LPDWPCPFWPAPAGFELEPASPWPGFGDWLSLGCPDCGGGLPWLGCPWDWPGWLEGDWLGEGCGLELDELGLGGLGAFDGFCELLGGLGVFDGLCELLGGFGALDGLCDGLLLGFGAFGGLWLAPGGVC
jgi:hypothetical protein